MEEAAPAGAVGRAAVGGGGGGGGGSDSGKATGKVTAAADDRTNTLVVVASPDTLVLVEKLVTSLDSDPTVTTKVETIQLEFADADSAAKLINTVFNPTPAATGNQDAGGGGGGGFGRFQQRFESVSATEQGAKVTAAAAGNSNTLVVTAPPETLKLIKEILVKLDSDPAAMSDVRIYQLKYADSPSAAKLITSIFTSDTTSSGQPPRCRRRRRRGPGSAHGGDQRPQYRPACGACHGRLR